MYYILFYNDRHTIILVDNENDKRYSIPDDENNTDYQKYLSWVAEGNTAEEWTGE